MLSCHAQASDHNSSEDKFSMPFGTGNTMNSTSSRGTPAEDGKVPRSSFAERIGFRLYFQCFQQHKKLTDVPCSSPAARSLVSCKVCAWRGKLYASA